MRASTHKQQKRREEEDKAYGVGGKKTERKEGTTMHDACEKRDEK